MASLRQPLYQLNPDNRGPTVIVVSYTLASISIAFTIVRFWLAIHRGITFRLDDATYTLAIVRQRLVSLPLLSYLLTDIRHRQCRSYKSSCHQWPWETQIHTKRYST
jgi:hypothetical protein